LNISYKLINKKEINFKMLSLEIEPYQDHDDEADGELVGDDSLP